MVSYLSGLSFTSPVFFNLCMAKNRACSHSALALVVAEVDVGRLEPRVELNQLIVMCNHYAGGARSAAVYNDRS